MSVTFTGLLLVHRLVGKSGLANLLRGVIKTATETGCGSAPSTSASGSQSRGAPPGQGGNGGPTTPPPALFSGAGSRKSILYVCLWKNPLTDIRALSKFSTTFYAQAASICPTVDVRLLLQKQIPKNITASAKNTSADPVSSNPPSGPLDAVFIDSGIPKADVTSFLAENTISESIPQYVIFDEDTDCSDDDDTPDGEVLNSNCTTSSGVFDIVALGGTFDRIHIGHKVLLSEGVLRARKKLIVGITDDEMIKSKSLCDLILPFEDQLASVESFMQEIAPPTLQLAITPISDPFGPAITEKDLGLLVVSQETCKGGDKINEIRKERGLAPTEIYAIELFCESKKQSDHEEDKISSSTQRLRNLGERLRPPMKCPSLPYLIGLTGGIASGKSKIAEYLVSLGAGLIDCDKLGHQAYTKGTACYNKIVETFGPEVVNPETCDIDRRAIGRKVFGKPEELKKLTDIVWPEIQRLVEQKVQEYAKTCVKIVIVDAAVLIEAKWDHFCHEVWVPFVPRDEAVRRIQERDKLSAEDAQHRIDSQLPNKERLKHATFAFSSLWEVEFTRDQVRKAWGQIQELIKDL